MQRQNDTYLLQNATKVDYKMSQVFLLQNTAVLLQNAIVITKCDIYHKIYWKKYIGIYWKK